MMRMNLRVAGIALVLLLGSGRLGAADRGSDKSDGHDAVQHAPFVHVVIIQIKKDAPEDEADTLITDAHEMLAKIPSVRHLQAGKAAKSTTPNVPKQEFQVGLLVLFNDGQGLEAYQKHPLHLKYVEKHSKYVEMEKLGVYDFVEPRK
jgi:hypothetical protein